jgi:hypothetical protein
MFSAARDQLFFMGIGRSILQQWRGDNSEEILSMYSEEIPTVQQYANLILTY